jgi:hypothetical protein
MFYLNLSEEGRVRELGEYASSCRLYEGGHINLPLCSVVKTNVQTESI